MAQHSYCLPQLKDVVYELKGVDWNALGIQLSVPEPTLKDIGSNHYTAERKLSEVIRYWINNGERRWQKIITALKRIGGHQNIIGNIESNYTTVSSSQTGSTRTKSSLKAKVLVPDDFNVEERKKDLHLSLYGDSESMVYKFQELFLATSKSLKRNGITVEQIESCVKLLGSIQPSFKRPQVERHTSNFQAELPKLAKARSVDDAMDIIKDYCSFFNYRMLDHIIRGLVNEDYELKGKLAQYKKDFAEYGKRHVFNCPSEIADMKPDADRMFVVLDDAFNDSSLHSIAAFIDELKKILGIPIISFISKLCYVEPGSVKLTFQLLRMVQQVIFPLSQEQEAQLTSIGVIKLSCEDYLFIKEDTTKILMDHRRQEKGRRKKKKSPALA